MEHIILCGKRAIDLHLELKALEIASKGADIFLNVMGYPGGKTELCKISRLRAIVDGAEGTDLQDYIDKNLLLKNEVTKTGSNDDIYIVPDPYLDTTDKKRVRGQKFTPKKKRKVKRKKTHRKK